MAERIDVLAVMDRQLEFTAASDYSGASEDHRDFLAARDAVAELIETQRDTLRMLEAAHRQLGMWTHLNKRIQRAKDALARVSGGAQ